MCLNLVRLYKFQFVRTLIVSVSMTQKYYVYSPWNLPLEAITYIAIKFI